MNGKRHLPVYQPNGSIFQPNSGHEPPPGSWAETARLMAGLFPDSDFDWDAWKDEMKESEDF